MTEIKKGAVFSVLDPDGLDSTQVKVMRVIDADTVEVKFLQCVWNLNTNTMTRRKGEKVIISVSRLK